MINVDSFSKDNTFMKLYFVDLVNKLENISGKKLNDDQKKKILIKIKKTVTENNSNVGLVDVKGEKYNTNMDALINFAFDEKLKPIMSAYGTFFMNPNTTNEENYLYNIVEFLIKSRKKFKNEMFKYAETDPMYDILDNKQKVFKVMGNSLYGVLCQRSFILANQFMGPSITYQGAAIITSSILALEAYLANNVKFLVFDDVCKFISNICNEIKQRKFKHNIFDFLPENKLKTKQDLLNYLIKEKTDFNMSDVQIKTLAKMIQRLNEEEVQRIYYKQNMLEFINNNETIINIFNKCMPEEGVIFNDIHKPSDAQKGNLELLYEVLDDVIAYKYAMYNRFQRATSMCRKAVIVCDTDSNFIALDNIYEMLRKSFGISESTNEIKINICNILTFLCSKYIQQMLDVFTHNVNIPEDKQPLINMKSEFLFSRVVLTQNKKQYASIVLLREGNVLEKPKLDIKGLSIKKVSVNRNTKKFFNELLLNDILLSNEIDTEDIIKKFYTYKVIAYNGIMSNDINYLKPGKYGELNSYKMPYRLEVVRGVMVWNMLYPQTEILSHSKVRLLKTNILAYEQLNDAEEAVPDEIKAELEKKYFTNAELSKFPLTLAIPLHIEIIPDWIKQFVDVKSVMEDNLNPALPLLKIFDVLTYDFNAKPNFSNVIIL